MGAVRLQAVALHLHGHQGRQDAAHGADGAAALPQGQPAGGAPVPGAGAPRAAAPRADGAGGGVRQVRAVVPTQRVAAVGPALRAARGKIFPCGCDQH